MNKILILSGLFIITLLSGCGNISNLDLKNHINTMNALDTYSIKVVSNKQNLEDETSLNSYVYVDNIHSVYLLSEDEKTNIIIEDKDIIFEYVNDTVFSYVFDKIWNRYEIDNSYLNIKNFESVLFSFFDSPIVVNEGNIITYTSRLNFKDLKGSMYNVVGDYVPDKYLNNDFEVTAFYDKELKRFTKFCFNLSDIFISDLEDKGEFAQSDASWMICFSFEDINKDFSLRLNEYQLDDHYNSFSQMDILSLDSLYSFDMIKGNIDYKNDSDIFEVEFESSGLYRISLRDITTTANISIQILDSEHNFIREENLSSVDILTKYFSFNEGTYYLVISSTDVQFEETGYKLLFLGN